MRTGGCLCGAVRYSVEGEPRSLDDAPFQLKPEAEIGIKRREPWLEPVAGAAQYEENRR